MDHTFETSSEAELLGGDAEPSWPELLGCGNWEGLLEPPMNLSLRRLILRCGNFSQATYDAFNYDVNSPYAGSSKYGKHHFFEKVMLESAADYKVECFLYATAEGRIARRVLTRSLASSSWDDNNSNFMGYIATTTDEVAKALGRREIYVVWRGTAAGSEWKAELCHPCLVSADPLLASAGDGEQHGCCCCTTNAKVMAGFLKVYLSSAAKSLYVKYSAREQVRKKIKQLIDAYKNENLSIIVTGHSLGASLSVLSAFDLVENGVTDIPVSAMVFACPKVGNCVFRKRVNSYPNLKILHIRNKHDFVPRVPCILLGYVDMGINLVIDNDKSPHLIKKRFGVAAWHTLEAMLHVVAGWNGPKAKFELMVERSVALVNKHCNLLSDKELVPAAWWVDKNKGIVRNDKGEWDYAPPFAEDISAPEFY